MEDDNRLWNAQETESSKAEVTDARSCLVMPPNQTQKGRGNR
jgi:hypothetical protein